MPRSRDELDNMSLDAHHLLHRSCRGKAHASGIAKQNNRQGLPSQKKSQDFPRQHEFSNGVVFDRKHSRNSTSSWECSDSDSMHSSEIGQNGCPENRLVNTNRGLERSSSVKYDAKERIKGSHRSNQCSPSLRATKSFKKENWADTLRVGCMNDRIRKMEKGWDDSNVIRMPKERKWHRITAEIEQRIPSTDSGLRMFGFKNSWTSNSKKVSKRSRPGHQRCAKPIQDIIEWEELFEMALARKTRRKIRENGKVESNVIKDMKRGAESGRAKDEEECMKHLEVLLENRVTPQTDEVRFAKDLKEIGNFVQAAESQRPELT